MTGFFVFNDKVGSPCSLLTHDTDLWRDVPTGGILRRDDKTATAFPSRSAAYAAIKRTLNYDHDRDGKGKRAHRFTVLELVPVKKGAAK